jgi:hypothetical protein
MQTSHVLCSLFFVLCSSGAATQLIGGFRTAAHLNKQRPMGFPSAFVFVPWHRGEFWLAPVLSLKLYREAPILGN